MHKVRPLLVIRCYDAVERPFPIDTMRTAFQISGSNSELDCMLAAISMIKV